MTRAAIGVMKTMSRKLVCVALVALLLTFSIPAEAQQPTKIPLIGRLDGLANSARIEALRHGFRELGYVEGKNLAIE